MTDPWGIGQPPAATPTPLPPLPAVAADLADLPRAGVAVDSANLRVPTAADLPEVRALLGAGWVLLSGAPLHALLPAAWPAELRTWVADRIPRFSISGVNSEYYVRLAPSADDADPAGDFLDEIAEAAGLPPAPRGRIWLLRSPWPSIPVGAVLDIIWSQVEPQGRNDESQAVYEVAVDMLRWDEERVLAGCPRKLRTLLEAWATAGRSGESAARPIDNRLSPADVDRLTTGTGLDEATALDWMESLETDKVKRVVSFANRWRAAGLPGNPPDEADRFTDRDLDELRSWLDAGFDLHAADRLGPLGLDTAVRWREAGLDAAATFELLWADPTLTPDEAHAFERSPVPTNEERNWVYAGFTADEATAWSASGVSLFEARRRRSIGARPDDQRPADRPGMAARFQYQPLEDFDLVTDPPGTRGRGPRRAAGDRDPWINSTKVAWSIPDPEASMPTAIATVATERAARYGKQLAGHFGHKIDAESNETGGRLAFSSGVCTMSFGPDALVLTAVSDTAEQLATLEDVVARHLVRFGAQDELQVEWHAAGD